MTDTAPAERVAEVDVAGLAEAFKLDVPLVLVDFVTDHCVWCERIEPVLASLIEAYRNRVHFVKINVERHPDAVPAGGIRATPTIALFRAGKLVMSRSGMMQRPALIAFLDHWLDPANEGL